MTSDVPTKTDKSTPVAETNTATIVTADAPKKGFRSMFKKRPSGKGLAYLAAVIVLVGGYALFNVLHNNTVTIGKTSISQQAINNFVKQLQAYEKSNPDASFGKNLQQYASDKLILNAALKLEAKNYGVTVNDDEMAKAGNLTFPTAQAQTIFFAGLRASQNNIQLINLENTVYQSKLESKLLDKKELTVVDLMLDTPYFHNLPQAKAQAAYDQAKTRMTQKFLPLVNKGASEQAIGAVADISEPGLNDPASQSTAAANAQIGKELAMYQSQGVVSVMQVEYQKGITSFNDNDSTSWIRGNIGKVYNTTDKIDQLKNPGDNTGLFASKAGNYTIIRLDSKTGGAYDSWADFLNHYKDQYAKGKLQLVATQLTSMVFGISNRVTETIVAPGLGQAWADFSGNCNETGSAHQYIMTVVAWDGSTGAGLSGGTIQFSRPASGPNSSYNYPAYIDAQGNPQPAGTVTACGETGTFTLTSNGTFTPQAQSSDSLGVHGNTFVDNCANTPLLFTSSSVVANPNPAKYQPDTSGNVTGTNVQWGHQLFNGGGSVSGLEDGFPDPPNEDGQDHIRPGLANTNTYTVVLNYSLMCDGCGQSGCPVCQQPPPNAGNSGGYMNATCTNVSGKEDLTNGGRNLVAGDAFQIVWGNAPGGPRVVSSGTLTPNNSSGGGGQYTAPLDGTNGSTPGYALWGNGSTVQEIYIAVFNSSGALVTTGPHPIVYPAGWSPPGGANNGSGYFATMNCSPPPNPPHGFIDSISCVSGLSGWATDPDDPGDPIEVSVAYQKNGGPVQSYIYEAGSDNLYTADSYRSDGGIGFHGFVIPMDPSFLDGSTYSFGVTAIGVNTDGDADNVNAGLGVSGGNSNVMKACAPFTTTGSNAVSLKDSTGNPSLENPSSYTTDSNEAISYAGNIAPTFDPTIDMTASCTVSVTKNGAAYPPTSACTTAKFNRTSIDTGGPSGTISNPVAGDQYCSNVYVEYISGIVQEDGTVLTGGPGNIPASTCPTVHDAPFVHFLNGDVSAGGGFDGSGSCANPGGIYTYSNGLTNSGVTGIKTTGSAVQIGALSIGDIQGFNSASLHDDAASPYVSPVGLTFSNKTNLVAPGAGGDLGGIHCVTNYFASMPTSGVTASAGSSIDLSSYASGQTVINDTPGGGTLNLNASSGVADGASIAIYVTGDVNITGNIKDASTSWASLSDIPSLYIIDRGGTIRVNPGVTQLDGIYVSQPDGADNGGFINTCSSTANNVYAGGALLGSCRNQLEVNGAFVAKQVYLDRSFGSLRDEAMMPGSITNTSKTIDTSVAIQRWFCAASDSRQIVGNPAYIGPSYLGEHFYQVQSSPALPTLPPECPSAPEGNSGFVMPIQAYADNKNVLPPGTFALCYVSHPSAQNDNYYVPDADPNCGDTKAAWPPGTYNTQVIGYVPNAPAPGSQSTCVGGTTVVVTGATEPLYTIYDTVIGYHFFTIDPCEYANIMAAHPNYQGGVIAYVYSAAGEGGVSVPGVTVVNSAAPRVPPLTCSNAGSQVLTTTCAAEVFNFSPEFYLSQPSIERTTGPTTGKYDFITSLFPVL